ncbi:MAG: ribose-5-phosphate isomerase RpiA [Streptococcaceae bacterium]|jgi:ribose 5-phosphate isomerase A|nr:ribose-5-phosphate isomerase RpiA [Streptococcaceae bacterium]
MTQDELKKLVGIESAKYVKNGDIVGLGTGSTAYFMVEELGRRMKEEGLEITGVTTSNATTKQATELGIPLKSIDEVSHVDILIDGADEISSDFQGTKGGGAALLFEKIVASYANEIIWIVDESKMVEKLGAFPLPIEVIRYGCEQLFHLFDKKGYQPTFRINNEEKLVTDDGNYIIDLHIPTINNPIEFAKELDTYVGVVEHGLFTNMVNRVIVGSEHGVKTIEVR